MKRILLIVTVICISFSLFAQKTNNRGEYLVKSVHWVNAFTQKEVGNKGISGIISSMMMMET